MYIFFKRLIDIIISIIGIIFLIPTIFFIKLLFIFSGDFSSIFYVQKRVGKDGKLFNIYKFRTMITNSEEILDELLKIPSIREEYECSFKIKNDPRITKIGRILRILSIDESPQFLNILKGDMSLIGPRPVVIDELCKYEDFKATILSIKPGLTGNWAVNGRSNTTYDERIALEVNYVNNLCFLLDLKIFFKTFFVVFKRIGAE